MGKLAKVYEVSSATSIDGVLTGSGTNWDAELLDADTTTRRVNSGGFKAIVRPDTNTALAYVGGRFRINNHRRQLHTLDSMVQSGDITPVSVSVWDNGAVLAYQFRCPGLDVVIRDRDVISPLLTLAFAYGSQLADSAFFADFRWFCKNQGGQVASLNRESKVKHRGEVVDKFGDVLGNRIKELSGELSGRYDGMRAMLGKPLADRPLLGYFADAIGASKEDADRAWITPADELRGKAGALADVIECYQADDAGAPGTVWQAYNAVTRYETHKYGKSAESRQRRMLLGSGSTVANRALQLAAAL